MAENINYKMLLENIKSREHLDMRTCYEYMRNAHEKGYHLNMLWKIKDEAYKNWYEREKDNLKTTLEEETLYLVDEQNKAFGDYGGYSIFAVSLGTIKRKQIYNSIDRIERTPIEYGIILNNSECELLNNYQ